LCNIHNKEMGRHHVSLPEEDSELIEKLGLSPSKLLQKAVQRRREMLAEAEA